MHTIYIEDELKDHPRVLNILERFKNTKNIIYCKHYGEIFNSKAQNFRLQKQQPALILAKKTGRLVLKTPIGFGVGGSENYYFSHMLNCLYDCRYCFLQGMFSSANYVVFVNYEDFMEDINKKISEDEKKAYYFFSGYDADSLVFDHVTHFVDEFIPFFETVPNAILELRTKSTNIVNLLNRKAPSNVIVAFSFTPQAVSTQVEHGVPLVEKRLQAMQQLARHGYKIGLRFDPMIYISDFELHYEGLIESIFKHIDKASVHSVTIGLMRFPSKMLQTLVKLYPEDKLLAHPLKKRGNYFSYSETLENRMKNCVSRLLEEKCHKSLLFQCGVV